MKQIFMPGLAISFLMTADICRAQLLPPNEAGITMRHVQLNVRDVEASKKFFLRLGGTPVKQGKREGIKYPGVIFFLMQGNPTHGTEGSAVDHLGFLMGVALRSSRSSGRKA